MVYWLTMHIVLDKITANYYQPSFLFPYFGFDWLQPWPGRGLHLHFVITLIASLGMLFGVFYRFSSIVFAIGFIYIAMLDKATYQNHYYLFCLLAILFAVCPADRAFSFDAHRLKRSDMIPRWVLWIFQFQIGLVYFFGGVAKINADWLHGFPMREVLASEQDHLIIGPFCQQPWFVFAFVWGGMLFDLFIVPLLMYSRTRPWAYLMTLGFHLMNASLFQIGVFPWAMIFLTTIFFLPDWPRRWLPSFFQRERTSTIMPTGFPPCDVGPTDSLRLSHRICISANRPSFSAFRVRGSDQLDGTKPSLFVAHETAWQNLGNSILCDRSKQRRMGDLRSPTTFEATST